MSSGVYVTMIKKSILDNLHVVPEPYRDHFEKWLTKSDKLELESVWGEQCFIHITKEEWEDHEDDIISDMMILKYGDRWYNDYGGNPDSEYHEFSTLIQPISRADKKNNPLRDYIFHSWRS